MKVHFISGLILLVLLFASLTARADCSGVACLDVTIESMWIETNGLVWIQTSGTETNLNCTPDEDVFLKLDASTPGGKNIYSGLLAYQVAGKAVRFRIVDYSDPCEVAYIVTE